MSVLILLVCTLGAMCFSFWKSRSKSFQALLYAKKMFLGIVLDVLAVMALVALVLTFLPPELIRKILGSANQGLSALWGALLGSVTIIPGFIAFPLGNTLHKNGAHLLTIAAFITTLTMVGVATFPIEKRHFGLRFALIRNGFSFVFAIGIAFLMGVVL